MNELDERLRESLRALAGDIVHDPQDLSVVRGRAVDVRRQTRRRAAWGALAVACVAAVVVALVHAGGPSGDQPIGPNPTPTGPTRGVPQQVTNPFTVLRTVHASALGVGKVLKVAAAPNGHVYVTDRGQHVTEIDATGSVVRRWGGAGTAPGEFRLYSGDLAVGPDGKVYVADTGNFRIQVFTPAGRFLAQYGGYGQGPGEFVWPTDVAVGSDGTMYVGDDRAATITALTPSGRQIWRHGSPGEADPRWVGHEHLGGVTAQGQLVTANDDTGRVLYVAPDGHIVDSFSTNEAGAGVDASGVPGGHFPNGTCGATFDAQGDVYVSSCEESYQRGHDTAVYDPRHRLVAGWERGRLVDSPVFGADGRAWAVTAGNTAVVELEVHLPGS